ncbi:MAG: MipA/OmpV family protein [Candidatus Aureabacteria bacterium]|nr:MipA/OmpV family protein [Candidatus Auribacterota bacterium]
MKGVRAVLSLAVFAIVLSFAFLGYSEEITIDAGIQSKYIWRGLVPTDGPVFQTSINYENKGFTINAWGNMDLDDANALKNEFSELDLTLEYAWSYQEFDLSAGIIIYSFPNSAVNDSGEFYFGIVGNYKLSPSLTLYYDYEEGSGLYASFDISHTCPHFRISDSATGEVVFDAGIGWADSNMTNFMFGLDESALSDLHLGLSVPIALSESWTIEPSVIGSFLLDSDVKDLADNKSNASIGINVSYVF